MSSQIIQKNILSQRFLTVGRVRQTIFFLILAQSITIISSISNMLTPCYSWKIAHYGNWQNSFTVLTAQPPNSIIFGKAFSGNFLLLNLVFKLYQNLGFKKKPIGYHTYYGRPAFVTSWLNVNHNNDSIYEITLPIFCFLDENSVSGK